MILYDTIRNGLSTFSFFEYIYIHIYMYICMYTSNHNSFCNIFALLFFKLNEYSFNEYEQTWWMTNNTLNTSQKTNIHAYTHTCIYIYAYICIHKHTHIHTHTYTYIYKNKPITIFCIKQPIIVSQHISTKIYST